MNKIITTMILAITSLFVGCTTIPTTDTMEKTSKAVGYAAGMVANQTKIDQTSRNAIVEIMNTVDSCVPATNQTFTVAWTPIAEEHVKKLIADGKIDEGQGTLIMDTFTLAVNGIDYLFNVKYPEARQYQELTEAAVHGFCDGFLYVFKPADTFNAAVQLDVEYDEDAYNFLKSSSVK